MVTPSPGKAFPRALQYLNYQSSAKWIAILAGILSCLVFIGLLHLLWLYSDFLVEHGQLPHFANLPESVQERYRAEWKQDPSEFLSLNQEEVNWRNEMVQILSQKVDPDLADRIKEDENLDQNHGILSLVVRFHALRDPFAPLISWLARWNPWAHNDPKSPSLIHSYLLGLLILSVLLAILGTLFTYLQRDAAAQCSIEAANRLRRAVYLHTFRMGNLAFRDHGPSEAVTAFISHISSIQNAFYSWLTVYFREIIKIGLLLLFFLLVGRWLALAFLLLGVMVWYCSSIWSRTLATKSELLNQKEGQSQTIIREGLMMMGLVKFYLMEPFNRSRMERQLALTTDIQKGRYRHEAIYNPLLVLIGMLGSLSLLFLAGVIVLGGSLSVASLVAMAAAVVSLYLPIDHWHQSRCLLKQGEESARQVFQFIEQRSDLAQMLGAEFLEPISKNIEFDNVSLREPGSDRMLLEEISFEIPAKKRIGLIGIENLEKHALVYLIPRLLDPTVGEIRIDQHNLRWITLDSLRNQIAVVLQQNLIFNDSIANNIGCGDPSFSLPQIIEAAKIAHAHHFIQKLPQAYDTPIGQMGHSLSLGEQYRIALARAILRDPTLLIIEEPETQLDEDTKSLLDDTMTRFLPGRTTIFIPHRISTISSCDSLFLLHRGKLVASGNHKELLISSALYRHLHYLEFNEIADQI